MVTKNVAQHRVLDLFAGTGVGVAVRQLGALDFGVEMMPAALATRDHNKMTTVYENAWDADLAEKLVFDTLWASPPCQKFSLAGKGDGRKALEDVLAVIHTKGYVELKHLREQAELLGDEKIGLVLSPLHYVNRYRPTYVVFEQVPPVLPVWEAMAVEMEEMGYSTWTGKLNSEQYGVPQARTRAFLIARLDGKEAKPPTPTHSRYYSSNPTKLDDNVLKWNTMFDALGWGWTNRPAPTVLGANVHGASGVELFDRGSRAKMLDGIIAGTFIGNGRVVNPNTPLDPLRLLPKESAKLQSYPDDFTMIGTKSKQFLLSGNAVPPLMAKATLEAVWA